MTTITRAVETCSACPSQWDAWDTDGNYWYLRYRFGHGTATRQLQADPFSWTRQGPDMSFSTGDSLDGCIGLDEFCSLIGLDLRLAGGETR